MEQRALGSQGLRVGAQGFGAMSLTAFYGPPRPQAEATAIVRRAVDLGVTLFDTAEVYYAQDPATGRVVHNEEVLGRAVRAVGRDRVTIATKFAGRSGRSKGSALRKACEASLRRLGVECIDLYYLHRVDPKTPIEETVATMAELVREGKVRYIGLSEASPDNIRRAHRVHPISAVQQEWSLWSRDLEDEVVPTCRELGIGVVPYSPVGRGFLTGTITAPPADNRRNMPRMATPGAVAHNLRLVESLTRFAASKGASAAQVAIAWVQHQGSDVVPIPGTTKLRNLEANVGALALRLSAGDMAQLGQMFECVQGARAHEEYMRLSIQGWQKGQRARV